MLQDLIIMLARVPMLANIPINIVIDSLNKATVNDDIVVVGHKCVFTHLIIDNNACVFYYKGRTWVVGQPCYLGSTGKLNWFKHSIAITAKENTDVLLKEYADNYDIIERD